MADGATNESSYGPQHAETAQLVADNGGGGGSGGGGSSEGGNSKLNWLILGGAVTVLVVIAIIVAVVVSGNDSAAEGPSVDDLIGEATPLSYLVEIEPNVTTYATYKGAVVITLNVTGSVNSIVLNSRDLNYNLVSERQSLLNITDPSNNKTFNIVPEVSSPADEKVLVFAEDNDEGRVVITPGQYRLTLEFDGALRDDLTGFYNSSYKTAAGATKYVLSTQFEPTWARRAFPCFDEPHLKSTFQLFMVLPKGYAGQVLSNTKLTSKTIAAGRANMEMYTFATTPVMSTYLLAWAVGDLQKVSSGGGGDGDDVLVETETATMAGTEINLYMPEGLAADTAQTALSAASQALSFYSSKFGISYESGGIPKLDMVAIPDFAAGAMENWGLMMFREGDLLTDGSSKIAVQRVKRVVCNEVAHQWFGNMVTMQNWTDLWLNEGLATFMEWECLAANDAGEYPEAMFFQQVISKALNMDSAKDTHRVAFEVEKVGQVNEFFDSLTKDKAAALIGMTRRRMESLLAGSFYTSLKNYLNKYKGGSATSDQFMDELRAGALSLKSPLKKWVTSLGFPVVLLDPTDEKLNTFKLNQTRYVLNGNTPGEDVIYPVTAFVASSSKPKAESVQLDDQAMEDDIGDFSSPTGNKWVNINYNAAGYYRSWYPDSVYQAYATELKTLGSMSKEKVTAMGTMLADALANVRSLETTVQQSTVFNLLNSLAGQPLLFPVWGPVFKHLRAYGRLIHEKPSGTGVEPLTMLLQTGAGTNTKNNNNKKKRDNGLRSRRDLLLATSSRATANMLQDAAQANGTTPATTSNTTASPSPVQGAVNIVDCRCQFKRFADKITASHKIDSQPQTVEAEMMAHDLAFFKLYVSENAAYYTTAQAKLKANQLASSEIAYVAAAAVRGDKTRASWDLCKQRMIAATDANTRRGYLTALGASTLSAPITEAINLAELKGVVRKQDAPHLAIALAQNPSAVEKLLELLSEKWSTWRERFGGKWGLFLYELALNLTNESEVSKLTELGLISDFPDKKHPLFKMGKDAAQSNVNFVKRDMEPMCEWLRNQDPKGC